AMPAYIQPWEIKNYPQAKKGSVITTSLYSTAMSTTYQIKIYLPFGYNTASKKYRSVYFQDGYEYVDLASAVNVLDNLIDSNKITEVIGIFVKPNNRNEEYAGGTRVKYQQFFVNELVPWVDANYRTLTTAENRLVLGDSYGANISALISYNYANIFGNCGLHSSAFQPNNFEAMTLIMSGVKKNIKYSAVWGTYESVYEMMRPFRDSVIAKGYPMAWMELPEGHSWGLWRASIDYLLMNIFPYTPNGISYESTAIPEKLTLEQNYPNPFNQETIIRYILPEIENVSLLLYDISGRVVSQMLNKQQAAGEHSYHFNASGLSSGMYFYELKSGQRRVTKKLVLLR
ncbi:MAG: T9SS type A sorting domain-containing protein, partial [Ignavibacteriales bacterium]|nr:T9SS type A sorting domain-containing protein [Ignavibacteriales bacterium]